MPTTLISGPGFELDRKVIESELRYLPARRRNKFASDEAALRQLIDDFYRREAVIAVTITDDVLSNPPYAYQLERAKKEALFAIALDYQRAAIIAELPPLDEVAEERYLADPERFRVAPQMNLRHILLRADTAAEKEELLPDVERLLGLLENGADFSSLALEHSQDSVSARRGGNLGWVSADTLVPEFAEAALALNEPGELSSVVETQYGLHIIELRERRPGRRKAFEEVKDVLIAQIKEDVVSERLRQWYESVIDPKKMTAHPEAIDDFVGDVLNERVRFSAADDVSKK